MFEYWLDTSPMIVPVQGEHPHGTDHVHHALHAEYVFSVFKMRLRKRTDTRIQKGWRLGRRSEYILAYQLTTYYHEVPRKVRKTFHSNSKNTHESASYVQKVEKWDTDSDSDETDEEDLAR